MLVEETTSSSSIAEAGAAAAAPTSTSATTTVVGAIVVRRARRLSDDDSGRHNGSFAVGMRRSFVSRNKYYISENACHGQRKIFCRLGKAPLNMRVESGAAVEAVEVQGSRFKVWTNSHVDAKSLAGWLGLLLLA